MLDYKKLYATLLGRVDDALQYMVYDINDPKRIILRLPRCCAPPSGRRRRNICRPRRMRAEGRRAS